ncbi:MAG: 3-keto-5-aminohexanoate cleavage protein, partial [Thermomicrobiales bacterium]|nr:3-keto-5-aminohexanoate cleavage protein [Thermomicrobiales bacterium]
MSDPSPVVIEVALNGGRRPGEHHALPLSAGEVADDAVRCFSAGATVAHFHARPEDGGEIDDADWCSQAIRQIRAAAPGMLVSMTSLRADGVTLESVIEQLRRLGRMRLAPDLMSVNLGHTVLWERESRTTV